MNGVIPTKDGTIYVSKPYRSRYSKKLQSVVTFVPRTTLIEASNVNEFRGFYSLFWISLFIFTVRTYVRSIEKSGRPLNYVFANMMSQDALTLAISDAVLVLSTGLCVPFAKAISKGWIKYYWTGVFIQHLFQTSVLIIAVKWTFNRQWPWVQSGFLTLHSLTMLMKMHSYMNTNGYLQWVSQQSKELLVQLREETARVGGWEQALSDAKAHRAELNNGNVTDSSTDASTPPVGTPPLPDGSVVHRSYLDGPTAIALRNRLKAVAQPGSSADGSPRPASPSSDVSDHDKPHGVIPHPLVDHPDEAIAALATEYSELDGELVSTGPEYVRWPENITFKNFAVYQLIPTLVYELEYPRTNRIRPMYIFEKTVATFGTFALLYTITETFIIPLTPRPDQSFAKSLLDLSMPFMIAYLLLFYIIFECICNGFAELSYFADRRFYEDWWNSTSWDEFSRKWNKPVHSFLLRHVYASTITSYRLSRSSAMFITFFISAVAHELVMAVVTQKIRMYLFALQLIQIPLIAIGRIPSIKRNKKLGNVVFWLGLYAGFPLLCVAYVAY
ncbi:MBOAT-domain-containing protein [Dentipellis sp. KUC8613]|nr:MBOAT-domain-containing protein [Dentipellis sp. KUC8613]